MCLKSFSNYVAVLVLKPQNYLKVIFFWFSPHYYIESFIHIFCSILYGVGHILLILVWIQKHPKCPWLSSKIGSGFRSWKFWKNLLSELHIIKYLPSKYQSKLVFLFWKWVNCPYFTPAIFPSRMPSTHPF